jgi:hypothetical protein
VTEAEWRGSTDPGRMLAFLGERAGRRKRRLFAAACCRRIWRLLPDDRSRRAVEAAEAFADGLIKMRDLAVRHNDALAPVNRGTGHPANAPYWATSRVMSDAVIEVVRLVALQAVETDAARAARGPTAEQVAAYDAAGAAGVGEQADLVRDLFGDIFHPPTIDPAWLAWGDGTVDKIAGAIYRDDRFTDLPILADALEDAGCSDQEILHHCRGGGLHARGCWVLDLLLQKH